MTTQAHGNTPAPVTTTEPPRATARFLSPNGVSWLVTVPAPTVAELLDRVALVEDKLLARQWKPAEDRPAFGGQRPSNGQPAQAQDEAAPVCAIHGKPMQRRSKDGRSWWSCNERLDDGTWCPYRPPKAR